MDRIPTLANAVSRVKGGLILGGGLAASMADQVEAKKRQAQTVKRAQCRICQ
jgi:hypothetical protein